MYITKLLYRLNDLRHILFSVCCFSLLAVVILILPACQKNEPVKLMTFNIRYDNPDDGVHAWTNRKTSVVDLIKTYNPDIFGIQEGLYHQVYYLDSSLSQFDYAGIGRDDGKRQGEYSAIFYNHDRYDLLDQDTFWLSEFPEIPGSMGWDAACIRIATWVKLQDKSAHRIYYVFNTHFDHRGTEARIYSALLLRRKVSEITGAHNSVIMGDFNATDTSFVYKILAKKLTEPTAHFFDTKNMSLEAPAGPDWTFQGFNPQTEKKKLDYIFYLGDARILSHETISDQRFGEYPSDHLPVIVQLRWQ
jgi:endonuclease/exonuclease/phosphatase family metal-dependent hydrolase